MKAELKFKLPEEQEEFRDAVHGSDYLNALRDIDDKLRDWLKYGHDFETPTKALEEVRKYMNERLTERGIFLW